MRKFLTCLSSILLVVLPPLTEVASATDQTKDVNYIVDGKMTAGFAFVAYPVEYGSSGVMSFVADKLGTIYEKDLGPNTTKLAQAMTAYDPDSTWHKAE